MDDLYEYDSPEKDKIRHLYRTIEILEGECARLEAALKDIIYTQDPYDDAGLLYGEAIDIARKALDGIPDESTT